MSLEAYNAVKKSRASLNGAVTRMRNRYLRLADENPSGYDLSNMASSLSSLTTTAQHFYASQKKIMEYVDEPANTPFNEDDELAAIESFEDSVNTTTSLINRLMAIKKASKGLATLRTAIEDLEELSLAHPDQDYSTSFTKLEVKHEALCQAVEESTIPEGSRIHQDVAQLQTKLHTLNLRERRPAIMTDRPSVAVPPKARSIQLPKLHLPTFSGDLMDWAPFWAQFRTAVDSNTELSQEHKLAYLRDAIKDTSIKTLMFSGAEREGLYSEVVELLHKRYDKQRTIHAAYCHQLTSLTSIKNTKNDLLLFVDKIKHAVAGLQHTEQYNLPSFLTSMLTPCLPKALQVEWEVQSRESRDVPPLDEFLQFVSFRADVLSVTPSAPSEAKAKPKAPDVKPEHPPRRHRATVYSTTTQPSSNGPPSTPGFRYECLLCPGVRHPLFQCTIFNDMSLAGREAHIRAKNLCSNCFAPGHQNKDCRSWGRCRQCGGKHHTLVHKERRSPAVVNVVASSGIASNDNSISNTNVPSTTNEISPLGDNPQPNQGNQTNPISSSQAFNQHATPQRCLMMTAQVLVKGPGGRQVLARALLDSGADMSLITSKLTQSLQLSKQAMVTDFCGAQGTPLKQSQSGTQLSICPVDQQGLSLSTLAAVVPEVTCRLQPPMSKTCLTLRH